LSAIRECDALGRDAFLAKYGFRQSFRYHVAHEGRLYDSKAIVGVAHRFQFPESGPLKASEFNGGESTVRPKLEELGFEMRVSGDLSASSPADSDD